LNLDCGQNRGANGLSGIGDPIAAPRGPAHTQKFGGLQHVDDPELLLLPQPATARANMSIIANRPICSKKSPFAGTIIDIDRPCPQLGCWLCPAELRFTRLTNAFSKKSENHCNMVAPYAVWYNFIRIHKTLRVTPAMESGIVDHLFSFEDLIGIVDEWEAKERDASRES
jgi:hypothetical protein